MKATLTFTLPDGSTSFSAPRMGVGIGEPFRTLTNACAQSQSMEQRSPTGQLCPNGRMPQNTSAPSCGNS